MLDLCLYSFVHALKSMGGGTPNSMISSQSLNNHMMASLDNFLARNQSPAWGSSEGRREPSQGHRTNRVLTVAPRG